MPDDILQLQGLTAFLVAETTFGTAAFPSAGTEAIMLREDGLGFPSQPTAHARAGELMDTASVTSLLRQLREAGAVELGTYLRPSGSAGTAPMEAPLLKAFCGVEASETVAASTSVTYALNKDKDSYTLWYSLPDGTVVFAAGLTVHGLRLHQDKDGFVMADWSAAFKQLGWSAATTLNGALAGGETDITVADGDLLEVGARVAVGTSTGHSVTAVSGDTVTVSPSVTGAQSDGADVTPTSLPTATITGAPLDARAKVELNGTAITWTAWELSLGEGVRYFSEVPADPASADLPAGYGRESARKVVGKIDYLARPSTLARLRSAATDKSLAIDFSHASAGSRLVVTCAQGRYNVPELANDRPVVAGSLTYDGKASSSLEDEAVFVYT